MKRGGPDHPKTFALAEALGIKRVHAVGLLEMLFHFTSQYAPQGDIGRYSMKRIAAAVDWSGSPVKLIAALVETGWVDTHPEVKLVVHDWSDHADRTTLQRLGRHGKIPIKQNHTVTDELCAQVDTKTRTPPSLSLSLSLSHKPVPLPVPPSAEATPAAAALDPPEQTLERETAAAVSRMQERHPYPSNGFDALYAFQRLVQTAVNPQAVLVSSEKNHAAWCEDWARQTAESGRTPWVPKLADFFRDGYHAKLPPVRDGPVQAKTIPKSKQERESDAAREQFAKLSKEKANEPRIHGNR